VQDANGGIAGATVEIMVSADAWQRSTTDASGGGLVMVPVSLTDSHLRVMADGYLPIDQHVDVIRGVKLTVQMQKRPPPHKGWPDSTLWPRFACDLDGVPVPAIRPFGQTDSVFSIILPVYPEAIQREILTSHRARGYTHFVVDPRPKYPPWYPSGDYSTPAAFRAVLQTVLDAGLMPVVAFDAAVDLSMSPDVALAVFRAANDAILTDTDTMAMVKIAFPAWEANDHITPAAFTGIARYVRAHLHPDALLFVHMTPRHAAMCEGDGCEAGWWRQMAADNVLDGILYQHQVTDTIPAFQERLKDFTDRLVFGMNGWPTQTGRGTPMYVIAFEYDAYWRTRGQTDEATGILWGNAALQVRGVSGYCDGGSIR
jgi:hypothetical protein